MRKSLAIAALGLLAFALPAFAFTGTDDADHTSAVGGIGTRVDCPGTIMWDTGMFDEFTPPAGCSTAGSAGCFINAVNDGAFPADGRRIADDFIGLPGDPITHVKIWARYNLQGYDYHLATPGSLHGFCVKFYQDRGDFTCPDGSVAGEDAIGDIVYDEYTPMFVEEEIFTGLVRNFNYCITLPIAFAPTPDVMYWVSVSADFDFTTGLDGTGVTQWFWRQYEGLGISFCESSWWDTWNTPNTNWIPISQGVNIPCWAGWDASFVLYGNPVVQPEGACCNPDTGECHIATQAVCEDMGHNYQGDGTDCDPNPCQPTATEATSWGQIKANFR
jgi:hypothetical protein